MAKIYRRYTRELLGDAVAKSTSVAGVLRHLGLIEAGGTHAHISRTIKRFGLDTSHFVRYQNGSAHDPRRLTAAEILVSRPIGSPRTKPPFLRRALMEIGRDYSCESCGNTGEWQGAALRLHVDHIDGSFYNNLAGNLRFLCPNCHSQTPNFAGLGRGKFAGIRPPGSAVAADTPALD